MSISSPSFLDTKQEHARWHHGLYLGLKIQNPMKLAKNMRVYNKSWKEWYSNDDHYHDFSALAAYTAKAAAVGVGFYVIRKTGLPV